MMNSGKVFRIYNIWPAFPSVSISGNACALNCRHCRRLYLDCMIDAGPPENLVKIAAKKREAGARGLLISGGCDSDGGLLNLGKYLPAIRKIHEMGMIIKLHTGLVDSEMAEEINKAGVDIASQEMVGDDSAISRVFGIEKTAEDFLQTFRHLRDAGIPHIAPHIVIGLHDGVIGGEGRALEMLAAAGIPVSTLALIVIRPTKGTPMADVDPPGREEVRSIAERARNLFPESKIILGALRPRDAGTAHRLHIELGALDGRVDGMEVPSSALLAEAEKRGFEIRRIEAFGVLPVEYESRL